MGVDAAMQMDGFVVDPPPPDSSVQDAPGPQSALDPALATPRDDASDLFHWTDSSPRRAERSRDLPFFDPPNARLVATREQARVRIEVRGLRGAATTRWEAGGQILGDGTSVEWVPSSDDDMLRVAVRTTGGVAILELRAREIDGVSHSLV
jgi:hypothetical protein